MSRQFSSPPLLQSCSVNSFEVEATSGSARLGRLTTPHGVVETPVFMPVGTVASVKGVSQDILEELGVQILLGNTYHLYLRPGMEQVRQLGGLHRFMAWPRAILTDSGGFQVFSLNELRRVTEEGVTFRSHLDGSSISLHRKVRWKRRSAWAPTSLWRSTSAPSIPRIGSAMRKSMDLTLRWASGARDHFEAHKHEVPWAPTWSGGERYDQTQALFGIVQGGMDDDLRKESAERTIEIGFPGYAIGGLSVGEPRTLTREVVEATLQHLPADKPRYLMGVGTPEEIVEYAGLGVDMMDCVLPTRAARHGLLFTSEGKVSIKQARYAGDQGPLDPNCGCRVCQRYSRAYLRHLYAANEVLAQVLNTVHNLSFYLDTMRAVRHSIALGNKARFFPEEQSPANS